MEFVFAVREDIPLILDFIRRLARYEGMEDLVTADEKTLEKSLFDEKRAEVLFVEEDGKKVGFALFFHNFSTFLGKSGIYLEDLFVLPEYRKKGYGKALIKELARITVERGGGRLEWWCLDSNTPAVGFYRSLGAVPMDEWTVFRVDGSTLRDLAE